MPVATILALASILAADAPKAGAVLPLRKLRLYETGVGYFERRGGVGKGGSLALPLPAGHLDDALKSIVILEATGSVRIKGLEFDSAVSEGMARAMAGLPEEAGSTLGYQDLLRSLVGAAVEVRPRGKTRVRGRLIDVEGPFVRPRPASKKGDDDTPAVEGPPPRPHYTLLLLDGDEALHRIDSDDVDALEVVDRGTASRLDVAAEALSDHVARRVQSVEIQAASRGQLGLGYIAEAPVWRTTYRVVLSDRDVAQLQGWALVHNDTDEDWRDIRIEMVNGRPASFLHPLAAPRYARRELREPPEDLSTVPQLANTTPDRMWLDGAEIGEVYGVGGLGLTGTGRGGGGTGEGTIGLGSVGTVGDGDGLGLGDLAKLSQASGEPSGALFVYRVDDPVDLDAHHSALLPILQQDIEAESITWFPADGYDPLSAVRLVNSTDQTLPGGTVSFFADGGFVGESMIGRLGPKERRFVAHGAELDVELGRRRTELGETTTRVAFRDGELRETYLAKARIDVTITNRSRRAKRVYVALDLPRRAELEGDGTVELDFDLASGTPLAVSRVEAGAAARHALSAKTAEHRAHPPTVDGVEGLLGKTGLPAETATTLREALVDLRKAKAATRRVHDVKRDLERAAEDLDRLRKNLEAVGKAQSKGRLTDRLTRQLLGKEDAISTMQRRLDAQGRAAEAAHTRAMATLDRLS